MDFDMPGKMQLRNQLRRILSPVRPKICVECLNLEDPNGLERYNTLLQEERYEIIEEGESRAINRKLVVIVKFIDKGDICFQTPRAHLKASKRGSKKRLSDSSQ